MRSRASHHGTRYFPEDPRPRCRSSSPSFKAKYGKEPDAFNAYAYDTMILMAAGDAASSAPTARRSGTGFAKVKDVPSVIFGKATFDAATRRVTGAMNVELVVEGRPVHALGAASRPR